MYELYIANKNYSSWSLRPWVLMRELHIPFVENLVYFGDAPHWAEYRKMSPSGKVPCLVDDGSVIWDSLSIAEYLAEREDSVWPTHNGARAWARSAAAEMHSGFAELRNRCSMNVGVRIRLHEMPAALDGDMGRLRALWNQGLRRFGGPFLAGSRFTAVDAFYAPVAFRIQTYGLDLDAVCNAYAARLLALDSLSSWYAAGLAETVRDHAHEAEILAMGTVQQDFRVAARASMEPFVRQ